MRRVIQQRKKLFITLLILVLLIFPISFLMKQRIFSTLPRTSLPAPVYQSNVSVEQALKQRRSIREYQPAALDLQQAAQLLWAAQGITSANGFRTAPSAGMTYPLEIYLVVGNINKLQPGVYHYLPQSHTLELILDGDRRNQLTTAANNQSQIQRAPCDIVITANYKRTTAKYGSRGERYVHMEAGHAAQNIFLQAVSLKLGTVSMGGFTDSAVKMALHLPIEEVPLYIMPVGKI